MHRLSGCSPTSHQRGTLATEPARSDSYAYQIDVPEKLAAGWPAGRAIQRPFGQAGAIGTRRRQSSRLLGWALTLAVVLVAGNAGCGSGDAPLATVDPDAAPLRPTYDQVAAILNRSCVPCHGGNSAGTVTAVAVDPDYSQCESTLAELEGLRATVLQSGSMPPGAWPRLSSEEKLLMERWLDQGACAPCSAPCP